MRWMADVVYANAYGRIIGIDTGSVPVALPYLPIPWEIAPPGGTVDRWYRIARNSDETFTLAIGDEPAQTAHSLEALSEQIEGDLHHWLATYTRGYLFVHAGCVAWRNRAIVIPGRSHTGKTTFTRALVEAGAVYYSDDYAVVDPEGNVWPFPRRLHVRPRTPGPVQSLDPIANNWPVGREPIRAALVAHLRFDGNQGWAIEQVTSGQGALALLDNTVAARERPQDSLRVMANLMKGARAITGTRDDAGSSAVQLLSMVDEIIG